jgi:hypothetical protein
MDEGDRRDRHAAELLKRGGELFPAGRGRGGASAGE